VHRDAAPRQACRWPGGPADSGHSGFSSPTKASWGGDVRQQAAGPDSPATWVPLRRFLNFGFPEPDIVLFLENLKTEYYFWNKQKKKYYFKKIARRGKTKDN
jgi:hypothetical protein